MSNHQLPNLKNVNLNSPANERHDLWVQCDSCDKWRRLPGCTDEEYKKIEAHEKWVCNMNIWDIHHASCSIPEEQETETFASLTSLSQISKPVQKLNTNLAHEAPPSRQVHNKQQAEENLQRNIAQSSSTSQSDRSRTSSKQRKKRPPPEASIHNTDLKSINNATEKPTDLKQNSSESILPDNSVQCDSYTKWRGHPSDTISQPPLKKLTHPIQPHANLKISSENQTSSPELHNDHSTVSTSEKIKLENLMKNTSDTTSRSISPSSKKATSPPLSPNRTHLIRSLSPRTSDSSKWMKKIANNDQIPPHLKHSSHDTPINIKEVNQALTSLLKERDLILLQHRTQTLLIPSPHSQSRQPLSNISTPYARTPTDQTPSRKSFSNPPSLVESPCEVNSYEGNSSSPELSPNQSPATIISGSSQTNKSNTPNTPALLSSSEERPTIPPPTMMITRNKDKDLRKVQDFVDNTDVAPPTRAPKSTPRVSPQKQSNINPINTDQNVLNWVQCEECKNWRRLPPEISLDSLPDIWYCSMNTWDKNYNNCEAEEEDSTLLLKPPNNQIFNYQLSTAKNLESTSITINQAENLEELTLDATYRKAMDPSNYNKLSMEANTQANIFNKTNTIDKPPSMRREKRTFSKDDLTHNTTTPNNPVSSLQKNESLADPIALSKSLVDTLSPISGVTMDNKLRDNSIPMAILNISNTAVTDKDISHEIPQITRNTPFELPEKLSSESMRISIIKDLRNLMATQHPLAHRLIVFALGDATYSPFEVIKLPFDTAYLKLYDPPKKDFKPTQMNYVPSKLDDLSLLKKLINRESTLASPEERIKSKDILNNIFKPSSSASSGSCISFDIIARIPREEEGIISSDDDSVDVTNTEISDLIKETIEICPKLKNQMVNPCDLKTPKGSGDKVKRFQSPFSPLTDKTIKPYHIVDLKQSLQTGILLKEPNILSKEKQGYSPLAEASINKPSMTSFHSSNTEIDLSTNFYDPNNDAMTRPNSQIVKRSHPSRSSSSSRYSQNDILSSLNDSNSLRLTTTNSPPKSQLRHEPISEFQNIRKLEISNSALELGNSLSTHGHSQKRISS